MTEIFWVICGLAVLLVLLFVQDVLSYQAVGHSSLVGWVVRHIVDCNFDAHAATLECYGEYLGLQSGTLGSGLDETPTTEGLLHGVFVVVTCSTSKDTTTATAVAHDLRGNALVQRRNVPLSPPTDSATQAEIDERFAREFTVESSSMDNSRWLTPALRRQLNSIPLSAVCLQLSGPRFVLTLGGLHASSVALLDHALAIVLTAALGHQAGPIHPRVEPSC